MDQENTHNLDLPLMANLEDIHVKHYILDLNCDMYNKVFVGYVILICEETQQYSSETLKPEISEPKEVNHRERNDLDTERALELSTDTDKPEVTSLLNEKDCAINENKSSNISRVKSKQQNSQICILGGGLQTLSQSESKDFDIISSKINSLDPVSQCCVNPKTYLCCSEFKTTATENSYVEFKHPETICEHAKSLNEFASDDFKMILDSWDLDVYSVSEIDVQGKFTGADNMTSIPWNRIKLMELLNDSVEKVLHFSSEKTCLKIWKPGITCVHNFPKAVKISFQTKQDGPSLKWTNDQDGRACVYTHGNWINNRSLFPSQDVPKALATWNASIRVPEDMVVLMSGDQNPEISKADGLAKFEYFTDLEVPSSTLALAVGHWKQIHILTSNQPSQIPCRLFTPEKFVKEASNLICSYLPKCMEAAYSLLGPHPFQRLDLLIVPSSFNSLGMASPHLMFLSQSVISDDGHMLIRIAHELSHSWFGLAIGPLDWYEEWLSEGFCTYAEAVIHTRARGLSGEEFIEEREIMDYLKFRTLSSELEFTVPDLQTLRRPMEAKVTAESLKFVSNGMNPDKGFLQLHYLKGYFLLRCLEETVGITHFHAFLKSLVEKFLHKLIDSMDVLQLYFDTFPHTRTADFSEEILIEEWLNNPGLPKLPIAEFHSQRNNLADTVFNLEAQIRDLNETISSLHWRKRRNLDPLSYITLPSIKHVSQVLLLLDKLLDVKKIHAEVLNCLNEKLGFSASNADVKHKWCELVVKHKVQKFYKDIRSFLLDHQAMGVYLFGELIISRDKEQRKLAEESFNTVSSDMEEGTRKIVHSMIYGDDEER